jgi:hypothetical protein
VANAPFPIQPDLTAIATRYRNPSLIADMVLPRVPVGKREFKYFAFTQGDTFTIPDTKVGRKSKPTEVEFGMTETPSQTFDYGLEDPIPQDDILNAPANYDPRGRAVEGLTDLILLDREKRTADLVFNTNTYGSGNKTTLSGTSQWNDFTNSDPIGVITGAMDAMIMRPNVAVFGRAVWTKLSQHPKIIKAVYGYANDSGIATRQQVAALLELSEILVGESWINTAKKGQTVSLSRVWGKHAALLHRDGLADTRGNRTTFGFTAEFGQRVSGSIPDPNIGLRGGERVRVGESVRELIVAADLGYLVIDAVA